MEFLLRYYTFGCFQMISLAPARVTRRARVGVWARAHARHAPRAYTRKGWLWISIFWTGI